MPRAISFVWTSAPLVADAKTVTRRDWSPAYARSFNAGEPLDAYDRRPDRGGEHLAVLRLTAAPTWEPQSQMPDSDYAAEGWAWLYDYPEYAPLQIDGLPIDPLQEFSRETFRLWQSRDYSQWVVRFELVELLATDYLDRLLARLNRQRERRRRPPPERPVVVQLSLGHERPPTEAELEALVQAHEQTQEPGR